MNSVALSADKRFHRAHIKPGRKRTRARRLLWPAAKYGGLVAAVLLAASIGAATIFEARVLDVDRIVVRGNWRMETTDVLSALDGFLGQSIVTTDLDAWRSTLLASPWIRDAAFRRSLPSTIEVVVSERNPIGIGRANGRLYLVDDRGGVIDAYGPRYADLDLPLIDGLALNGATDEPRAELAARVIESLRAKPSIARRLSQVVVTDIHNAAVIVSGDPALIYVGEDRFLSRVESYLELAATLRERVSAIDYVDLRVDDRIFLRPAGRAGKAAPGAGGASFRATGANTLGR